MKRYGLKAINDEATVCSVCGKIELRRVMWLVELAADGSEIGEVFAVGTTCGAKLLGYSAPKMRKAADNFAANVQVKRDRLAAWRAHDNGAEEIFKEIDKLDMSFLERKQTELWAQWRAIKDEAHEWAQAQDIVIAL